MKDPMLPESSGLVSSRSRKKWLIILAAFSLFRATFDVQSLDRSFSVSVKIEFSRASNLHDVLDVLPSSRPLAASLITEEDGSTRSPVVALAFSVEEEEIPSSKPNSSVELISTTAILEEPEDC
jgi:hypothetical protein